jgi:hypothetical protein
MHWPAFESGDGFFPKMLGAILLFQIQNLLILLLKMIP